MSQSLKTRIVPLTLSVIDQLREEWSALLQRTYEANPFYEPHFIQSALRFKDHREAPFLFELRKGSSLIGLYPLEKCFRFGKIPVGHVRNFSHSHLYLGMPLVVAGEEDNFAQAFCEWLDRNSDAISFVALSLLYEDGPVIRAFNNNIESGGRIYHQYNDYERPALKRIENYDHYLATNFSAKARSKLRANYRKLEASAPVGYEVLSDGGSFDVWFNEFLKLEHAGWKGENGTSLMCDVHGRTFFHETLLSALQNNNLRFTRLLIGNKAIAYSFAVGNAKNLFALKIAYDLDFAKLSPGFILEHENIRSFLEQTQYSRVDSCATRGATGFDKVMPDRVAMTSIAIGRKTGWRKNILPTILMLNNITKRVKSHIKI